MLHLITSNQTRSSLTDLMLYRINVSSSSIHLLHDPFQWWLECIWLEHGLCSCLGTVFGALVAAHAVDDVNTQLPYYLTCLKPLLTLHLFKICIQRLLNHRLSFRISRSILHSRTGHREEMKWVRDRRHTSVKKERQENIAAHCTLQSRIRYIRAMIFLLKSRPASLRTRLLRRLEIWIQLHFLAAYKWRLYIIDIWREK